MDIVVSVIVVVMAPWAPPRGPVRAARRSCSSGERGPGSAALEHRLAPLVPGRHALADVLRAQAGGVPGIERLGVQFAARELVDRALHAGHGERRLLGEDAGQAV